MLRHAMLVSVFLNVETKVIGHFKGFSSLAFLFSYKMFDQEWN